MLCADRSVRDICIKLLFSIPNMAYARGYAGWGVIGCTGLGGDCKLETIYNKRLYSIVEWGMCGVGIIKYTYIS